MRPDTEVYLIAQTKATNDAGDPVKVETERRVFMERRDVRQSEYYQAAAAGMRAELLLVAWTPDYEGESILRIGSERYKVNRTYRKSARETELICEGLAKG